MTRLIADPAVEVYAVAGTGVAGWHSVVAATTMQAGLKPGKLDGFSVGTCRR